MATAVVCIFLSLAGHQTYGQGEQVGLEKAMQLAVENNRSLRSSQVESIRQEQLTGSAWNIDKTAFYYLYDENNIAENGAPIRVWGINQTFEFPTVYGARHQWQKEKADLQQRQYRLEVFKVKKEVAQAYYTVVYRKQLAIHYVYLDSLYKGFAGAAEMKFEAGESNLLERLTAESKSKEMAVLLAQGQKDMERARIALNGWIQGDTAYQVIDREMPKLVLNGDSSLHPGMAYYKQLEVTYGKEVKVEKQQLLPDIQVSLFQGTNQLADAKQYRGIQAGVAIPLWFGAQRAKIRAAQSSYQKVQLQRENYRIHLQAKYLALLTELKKYRKAIEYYEQTGEELASGILANAQMAYREGEIDYLQYIQLLENARNIEINYLRNLWEYNMTVLEANYLTD